MIDGNESRALNGLRINIFQRIFSLFTTLEDLDFGQTSEWLHPVLAFNSLSEKSCFSSTIVNLRISVDSFNDCLCLLDGRLSQLRVFIVRIIFISDINLSINNTVRVVFYIS